MTMTVHAVRDLPVPPESVYAAFTDARTIRQCLDKLERVLVGR
jgi:uncharacterized protein YndB with AHSA1/START domain